MKTMVKLLLVLSFFITLSCGFKVADKSNINNFSIREVNTNGNNRINYKIKNYLLINTQDINSNVLSLEITTKIIKKVKEKNIKNEITKYEVALNADIKAYFIDKNVSNNFNLNVLGDYLVHSNYSTTITNEKKLVNNLTERLSKLILKKIRNSTNDL